LIHSHIGVDEADEDNEGTTHFGSKDLIVGSVTFIVFALIPCCAFAARQIEGFLP
jgi:hypothetical protein